MTYIWINPVTEHMYQASALESFLERHGLTRVRCRRDWGAVVREKYQNRAKETGGRWWMHAAPWPVSWPES